ncbi:MAG: hypothetical protein ABMA13_04570, partial [Chthoniobacteraceae bacterium]
MKAPVVFSRPEPLEARIAPATTTTLTWQGDVGAGWDDGTVNTNTNWLSNLGAHRLPVDGNILVFPAGAGNKTNVNDIAGLDLRSITINEGGYTITGQPITLSGGITSNVAGGFVPTFAVPVTLVADQTFANNNGANQLQLGLVDLGGHALTISATGQIHFSTNATKITGAGAITKTGTADAIFFEDNDYTGPTQVDAGTLQLNEIGALGASGAGNGTSIASGATLTFATTINGTLAEDITIAGTGAAGVGGAMHLNEAGGSAAIVILTGALRLSADATIQDDGTLTLAGAVGATDDALAVLTINNTDTFAFANTANFTTELAGTTPGAGGHDQLKVIGPVNLGGAALDVVPAFTPAVGAKFTIVDNDGADPIVGTFAGKAEGAAFTAGGVNFTISYKGVDGATGNDVVLTVASLVNPPLAVTLSTNGKTATFIDTDGDNVTVKTTKGPFQPNDFSGVATGVAGGGQLQLINLTTHAADFTGAGITITAKPGPLGGNGFVNVGYVNATGIDLGAVKIAGDLGRINAGTVGGDAKVPALKSLDVQSLGLLGTSTQAAGGDSRSIITGALAKLAVKGDMRGSINVNGATDGKLGSATIGGSIVNNNVGPIFVTLNAQAGIGSVKVAGDLRVEDSSNGIVIKSSDGGIGSITVGGSLIGVSSVQPVFIGAFGQSVAPAKGTDFAIKTLKIGGSVENTTISVGGDTGSGAGANTDASIGSISVGGDWIASTVQAGISGGADLEVGNNNDVKFAANTLRDNPDLFSSIGSFTVKGQALGTSSSTTDMFGAVAERIGKAKVGGRTFAFTKGATPEAFFAAPTLDGAGAENPAFDFTIRELGSLTPIPPGGTGIVVSADGRTATFTDVDGDDVTVKRSAGAFTGGEFTLVAGPGGSQLSRLILTVTGGAPFDVSITARPGAGGGNGFVNVGDVTVFGGTLGKLTIAGDLGSFSNTGGLLEKPAVTAFTAHSLGQLGTSTGATQNTFSFFGSVPKFTVAGDVRGASIIVLDSANLPGIGKGFIGGSFIGGATADAGHISVGVIGSLKIGGSVRSGAGASSGTIEASASIGSIAIGGDIVGSAAVPVEI